ncbi:NnrS family protein [Hyphomicrobium sp. GJ21]|uniref:NnrS family protein n=1 Tax=Hyphomicrobium sp. GJ21 TaxID=113574 RepID=UPI000622B4E8|nr:NnrS family protein [Hyphomicrobium sp. GJ21]CEJ86525.1 NnrS family protein [Hyphomicrobium sp. GJ21]
MYRVRPVRFLCAEAYAVPPFRIFFVFAALDAIAAIAPWLPRLLGYAASDVAGVPLAVWHRDELLLGMMPAVLAGFVLTALPRWTRCAPASSRLVLALAGLWLAGRVAHVVSAESIHGSALVPAISFLFIVALSLIAARQVIAGRAWREIKVVLLLAAFAAVTGFQSLYPESVTALRLGLASVLALVVVLGGRIVPALTAAWLEARGQAAIKVRGNWLEPTAAVAVIGALLVWAVAPEAEVSALASWLACFAQAGRLVRWQGWRAARSAPILALHVGYSWIPIGFALHAAAVFWPSAVSQAAALHAWGIGVIGLMGIAVMASMIRRHARTPFAVSASLLLSLACAALAAPARIVAEATADSRHAWLPISGCSWIAAFALFLFAFRKLLLRPSGSRK